MADSLDQQLAIADVYAAALFELARDAGAVSATREELGEFVKLQEQDADFAAFMCSSAIDPERRAAVLEKTFRGKLSDMTLNTLLVMNAKGRGGLAAALRRAFVLREEDAAGQVEGIATSAVELSGEQRHEIERVAAEVSGKKPLVEFVVDPSLIGGLTLQIGDLRYDNSVRRQLSVAAVKLRERGERGLRVEVSAG